MITALVALAHLLSLQAGPFGGQDGGTLADYLTKHPWDSTAHGSLLVVSPNSVQPTADSGGLRAFARKEFNLGTLSVIAPSDMVYIDATLKDPPNLYDGLPRRAKILYLMSLLDADQWRTACSTGIGLSDLRQDQRAVLRSILPSAFTYENYVVGKENSLHPNPDGPAKTTLTQEEELGVRLHFFEDIELGVKLQNGGFSAVGAQLAERKREGKPFLLRSDNALEDRTTLFGVQIRKVVENKIKPSDLNYKSKVFDPWVQLSKTSTIGEVCTAIGAACGLKILADVRVSALPVTGYGESARAGDILQALALSVTGTFRNVGGHYVLTCDLEGIGAKRLKIDAWKSDLEGQTRRRVQDWKRIIGTKGGAHAIAMRTDGTMPLNDAMARFMSEDHDDNGTQTLPANQLPPEWQAVLNSRVARFSHQQMRTDVAFPYGEVFWNFVLPDGRSLEWEESLGHVREFTRDSGPPPDYKSRTEVKPIELKSGSCSAAMFKTDDPSVAANLPDLAAAHGFEEIWIQTWSGSCLTEIVRRASALHLRVRLILKPWEVPLGKKTPNVDKNIFGQSSLQAEIQFESTFDWIESSPIWGRPPIVAGTLIAPDGPMRDSLWRQLVDLSKSVGLSGIVLCDTQPRGYEPHDAEYYFHVSNHFLDLGYTPSLRQQFLDANQVDPIDIVDRRLLTSDKLDLSLPFFGDPNNASVDQPSGSLEKWNEFRAGINKRSVEDLLAQLPTTILVQPRHRFQDTVTIGGVQVVPWEARAEFPVASYPDSLEGEVDNVPSDGYCVWQFGHPTDPVVSSRIYVNLLRHMKHAKGMFAADLSALPIQEIPNSLDQWFVKG